LREIVLLADQAILSQTNGANSITQVESTTNKQNYLVVQFLQSVQSFCEWKNVLPSTYDGSNFIATFYWIANDGTTNSVVWGLQARAFADGDAIDQAYGIAQQVTDANHPTNDVNISAPSAGITPAGAPAAGKWCQFRAYRLGSDGDNLAATARLAMIRVTW
jgi:hypothetical protein